MRHINLRAAGLSLAGLSSVSLAGPYSTGAQNTNPGAVDPGLPGFVGPLGDGQSASPNVVNPAFVGWATSVKSYQPAPGVDAMWSDSTRALGPVTGDNFDIVSLGDLSSAQISAGTPPGQITLQFKGGIANAAGPDFAVFENAFGTSNGVLAELAYVEVSSDGDHFARFPSDSLTPSAVGPFGTIDPTNVHNLPGKHVNAFGDSWGTPLDLSDLSNSSLVQSGQVNLHGIRYVRLVDIPGDGSSRDSSGRPIYDAWQTFGSGGFDLEAVGVTNAWLGGDATLDGRVDESDLGILALNWQRSPRDFTEGDFDLNGVVDVNDLGILASHWQGNPVTLQSALATLPEPGSILGTAFAASFLGVRRIGRVLAVVLLFALGSIAHATVADFEDNSLPPNSFYNGSDSAGGFTSRGVHFSNSYDTMFESWSGFGYSNVNNTTTAGFGNQYAAITATGFGGAGNYGVAFDPGPFGSPPTITLPFDSAIQGLDVTNTTYAYLALRDGNDGFGAVRQFGDDPNVTGAGNQGFPDFFKLTITGKDGQGNSTGSVDFYLADYRFPNNADDYVVNDWRFVDLTSLGDVKSLTFRLDSSDTGDFGINTPTYFALDNVTFVPEPSMGLVVLFVCLWWGRHSCLSRQTRR